MALVNDILDISKIESGKFTINEGPYNLQLLLFDLEQMLLIRAKERGIELKFELGSEEPWLLMGDVQRISQILVNLIGNAIKFTEDGWVKVKAGHQRKRLLFEVIDTGIGIPQDKQEILFQRYEQVGAETASQYGGSGLGLFISRNLATMMGGTITVDSSERSGSTFLLDIPYVPTEQHAEAVMMDVSARTYPSADTSGELFEGEVLVAEDNLALQLLERRILEKCGIKVTVVGNGAEVIQALNDRTFDLILMDMQMPVMDGLITTQTLRESGITTPVIALTANVLPRHRKQFEEAGCDGFIAKPIDKEELFHALRKYLRSRPERRRAGRRHTDPVE